MQQNRFQLRSASVLIMLAALSCLMAPATQKLVIANWKREIDVTTQTPIYHDTIQLENDGTSSFDQFEVAVPKTAISLISHIIAEDNLGNKLKASITDNDVTLTVNDQEKQFYFLNIALEENLSPGSNLEISLKIVYFGHYSFLPEAIDLFVN